MGQLKIYIYKPGRKKFADFPSLVTDQEITDDELAVYCNHIETLTADMETRFCDLFELEILDWILILS